MSDEFFLDLRSAIFIDQHAHSFVSDFMQFESLDLKRCFSESRTMEMLQNHVEYSLSYMDMMRKLGTLLDVSGEAHLIELRQTMREYDFVNSLFDDVSFGAFIIDDGYSSGRAMSLPQFAQLTSRPVFRCLRLETAIEQALAASTSFVDLENKFVALLSQPSDVPIVAFKTILAYRGGLKFLDTTKELASQDYADAKAGKVKGTSFSKQIRIECSNLHHYLLLRAFEIAGDRSLPVQIHTGLGDSDEDLAQSNPVLLRSVFENKSLATTKFVLLHCYPFVREAAYLASLYPNVYMDLSLACFLVSAHMETIMLEALSLAPASKILAGTDGHTAPETYWYGALSFKRSLAKVLTKLLHEDMLDYSQAVKVAALILHENARSLYKLEGLA